MAITTTYTGSSAAWNNANWSNGFPNAIDTYADLIATAGATLTVGAGLSYTLSSLSSNDNAAPYTDWVVAGSNATTSKLIFATSSNVDLPYISATDGATLSVGLSGSQGLRLIGGYAAGDTITISNLNNTLYGPLQFDYTYNTIISGKLTASGSITSANNFAGVSYTGILGLLGKVDVQTSGLNIRDIEIIGNLDPTSELSSSNNSYVINHPGITNSSFKCSVPVILSGANEWGRGNTDGVIVEYSGVISGVSPTFNGSSGLIFALINGTPAPTGSVTLKLTNTSNTFTGYVGTHIDSFSDTADAVGILEYLTVANAGKPSSLGAGTGGILPGLRGTIYRCIGAGGTTNRQLTNLGGNTSNYSLENNGSGPIIFNNTTSSTFVQWPVLGGTNLDLNEIAQPVYFTKPLVKDGTGRWALSGEKRFLPVAAYNSGPKPWLTSTGKALINNGYTNDFISVLGGYLRFNPGLDLRHQATNATTNTFFRVYSGGALELNGTYISSYYQVAATATVYGAVLYLNGYGPNNDGALINISGSNDVLCTTSFEGDTLINVSSGSIRFNEWVGNNQATITGSGTTIFDTGSQLSSTNIIKNNPGVARFAGYRLYNSTVTNQSGTLELSSSIAAPTSVSGYLNVSGGVTQTITANATRVFNGIILNTGSFVHTLNADLQLSGTILYANATASNVFSYSYPTGRVLKLISGAGFGVSANKTGSIDISYDYSGSIQSNIITESGSLLTMQSAYSSSTGYGFDKNGAGTLKMISSASYAGTTNLYSGTTIPKNEYVFGKSSVNIQNANMTTQSGIKVQISSSLTLDGASLVFGANV